VDSPTHLSSIERLLDTSEPTEPSLQSERFGEYVRQACANGENPTYAITRGVDQEAWRLINEARYELLETPSTPGEPGLREVSALVADVISDRYLDQGPLPASFNTARIEAFAEQHGIERAGLAESVEGLIAEELEKALEPLVARVEQKYAACQAEGDEVSLIQPSMERYLLMRLKGDNIEALGELQFNVSLQESLIDQTKNHFDEQQFRKCKYLLGYTYRLQAEELGKFGFYQEGLEALAKAKPLIRFYSAAEMGVQAGLESGLRNRPKKPPVRIRFIKKARKALT